MIKSQIKEYLPFVQALAEGKTIQHRKYDEWRDLIDRGEIYFNDPPENYRIKSTPTLRPWKPEEVPVGALLRWVPSRKEMFTGSMGFTGSRGFDICMIIGVGGIRILTGLPSCNFAFDSAFVNLEHSLDHGITWKPCGVME